MENERRELLICFTPTPPPQIHSNRQCHLLLPDMLSQGIKKHRSGNFLPFAF